MKARKSTDPLVVGAIAGTVATVSKELLVAGVLRKLYPYDIGDISGIEKAAGLILNPDQIKTKSGRLAGSLMDIVVGSIVASLYAELHKSRTIKANPLNGALFGLGIWAVGYGMIGKLSSVRALSPLGAFFSAGWHAFFGGIVGKLVARYGEQDPPQTLGRELSQERPRLNESRPETREADDEMWSPSQPAEVQANINDRVFT